jgi:hypothetical protein
MTYMPQQVANTAPKSGFVLLIRLFVIGALVVGAVLLIRYMTN